MYFLCHYLQKHQAEELFVFQGQVEREDLGQHLVSVEDMLQKHSLLEQDIAVHGDRVKAIEDQSLEFLNPTDESMFWNAFISLGPKMLTKLRLFG